MERLNLTHEVVRMSEERGRKPELSAVEPLQKPAWMPFTVRIATEGADLEQVVRLRRAAYGRHVPEFAQRLGVEEGDRAPGTTILLAESKLDGALLGTMRIQTSEHAPLPVQRSVALPDWCSRGRLAEATRLAVAAGGPGRVVKVMLFKALFLFCEQQHIDWMIITARAPLDREYETMLFQDVFGDRQFIPMPHVGNLPHRVLAGEVSEARRQWREAGHPLFGFVFQTHHPDIDLRQAERFTLPSDRLVVCVKRIASYSAWPWHA
jgi:hypothetical protein